MTKAHDPTASHPDPAGKDADGEPTTSNPAGASQGPHGTLPPEKQPGPTLPSGAPPDPEARLDPEAHPPTHPPAHPIGKGAPLRNAMMSNGTGAPSAAGRFALVIIAVIAIGLVLWLV
jgi:hypothetical protein